MVVNFLQPVGRSPDACVCLPDGVDHAGVEECQKEDWNGIEDEKTEFVDWVTLIMKIFFQNIPD